MVQKSKYSKILVNIKPLVLELKMTLLCFDISECSGDQDSVLPLTGSRALVNKLAKELGLKTTVPYRSWLSDKQVYFPSSFANQNSNLIYI